LIYFWNFANIFTNLLIIYTLSNLYLLLYKLYHDVGLGTVKMLALDFFFQSIHFFEALSD